MPAAAAALNALAGNSSAAKGNLDVPYTPGSTIAVSRLSIPSTGWRSTGTSPISATLAAASIPVEHRLRSLSHPSQPPATARRPGTDNDVAIEKVGR